MLVVAVLASCAALAAAFSGLCLTHLYLAPPSGAHVLALKILYPCAAAMPCFPPHPKHRAGTDVSEPVSSADFSCLKGKGFDFVVIRAFQSNNVWQCAAAMCADGCAGAGPQRSKCARPCAANARLLLADTVKAAWAGGQEYVDGA